MSYLDSEAVGKLGDMLDEGTPMEVHEEAVQESSPDVSEVKEELYQSDAPVADEGQQAPAGTESSSPQTDSFSDSGEIEEGVHRVPYKRFRQVIDARNQLRNERDILSRQVQELASSVQEIKNSKPHLAAQPQEVQNAPAHRQSLAPPEFLSEEEAQYFNALQSEFGHKYDSLASKVQGYELNMAEQQLEVEISSATNLYPDVPRRAILESVASGNVNVMDVAERYQSFVNQMREQAIADYLQDNPQSGRSSAAPRPSRTGSSPVSVKSSVQADEKPKNLADAHRALSKFLKTNNIF